MELSAQVTWIGESSILVSFYSHHNNDICIPCTCKRQVSLLSQFRHCKKALSILVGFVDSHINKTTWYILTIFLTDIDECAADNGGCEQNCVNAHGSFVCECNSGYGLNLDKKSCDGKPDFE